METLGRHASKTGLDSLSCYDTILAFQKQFRAKCYLIKAQQHSLIFSTVQSGACDCGATRVDGAPVDIIGRQLQTQSWLLQESTRFAGWEVFPHGLMSCNESGRRFKGK